MNRIETFPVSIRGYADPDMRRLMKKRGGVKAAGQWFFLLMLLYDSDGCIKLDELSREIICETLEISDDDLDGYLETCAELGFIDKMMLDKRGEVISRGVVKQIEYIEKKQIAGSKGGKAKKGGDDG